MFVAYRLSPFWRTTTLLSLLAALALVLIPGCAGPSRGRSRSSSKAAQSEAPPIPATPTAQYASYGVSWTNGSSTGEGTYRLAYVLKDNEPVMIDSETGGFQASDAGQAGAAMRSDKIRSYLSMSPIRAIIGDRTEFTMGETYNGIVMEGGKPLFTYTCDREEEIAGVKGQRITVKAAKKGSTELELVLSKDYPFPLYVKEHTGVEPLQIFLKDRE